MPIIPASGGSGKEFKTMSAVFQNTHTHTKERKKRERATYMLVHTYGFSSRETEGGGPEFQGHLGNHSEFKFNLEYMTCCLKGNRVENRYRTCIETV